MNNNSSQSSRKAPEGRAGRNSTEVPSQKYEVIRLGVDTHAAQHTFARKIDNQGSQPPQSLSPTAFLTFLTKQLSLARRVVMVYEAGPYGFSLYRKVVALGVECLVCAPERMSHGRKLVNDKIDAKELLSRLDRFEAGNNMALRVVHPPTLEQELSRNLARERNAYRKERQRWMARGRSVLHTMGVSRPGDWWKPDRYAELRKKLCQEIGLENTELIDAQLQRDMEMVNLMSKKLDELTSVLESAARAKKQPRIKGIGPLSSELLDREIGDWNRFKNRRQVASYTGLCPGQDSSGDDQRSLPIDKHGNPRVRAVLVELAWMLYRFQPDYKPLRRWKWVFEPGAKCGKAMRKKAAVALARHLVVDLWRIKTGRIKPGDVGLKLIV